MKMYLIASETKNPFFNLALDEFLLKKSKEEFIILSVNSTSVISGKHQCIHKEINTRFVTENKIPVLRRITGGGTVFHDEGNLNYSFIINSESGKQVDFPKYCRPVISFLESIGIKPEMKGTDILVNGKKISGNAEHVHRNRVLHHGTLLFDASLDNLRNSLRGDRDKYSTKAVASNPSHVVNINGLTAINNIRDFRSLIEKYFLVTFPGVELHALSDAEQSEINEIAEKKYNSWEWNFAYGPEYSFENKIRLNEREISFRLNVREGIIRDIVLNDGSYRDPLKKLTGVKHMPAEIKNLFRSEGIENIDVYSFF